MLPELLEMSHVTMEKNINSLQESHAGTSVILKWDPVDTHTNGWQLDCPWRANIPS